MHRWKLIHREGFKPVLECENCRTELCPGEGLLDLLEQQGDCDVAPVFPGHTGGNVILAEGTTPPQNNVVEAHLHALGRRKLIGTCKDCRWWRPMGEGDGWSPQHQDRNGKKEDHGVCRFTVPYGDEEPLPMGMIRYARADFGCVHWVAPTDPCPVCGDKLGDNKFDMDVECHLCGRKQ